MKTLKQIANDLDETAAKMKQCAEAMREHKDNLPQLSGYVEELSITATIARHWAKEIRKAK